jgi:hypothetical protein
VRLTSMLDGFAEALRQEARPRARSAVRFVLD